MTKIITDEPPSIPDTRSIADIYDEICRAYLKYPQPWVIGYSGGKDSTTVLHLIWKALGLLPQWRQATSPQLRPIISFTGRFS